MKKIKLFFAAALLGMTMMTGIDSAEAYVSKIGKVQAIHVSPEGGSHYIYVVGYHGVTVTSGYYCKTPDDNLIQVAKNAIDFNLTVKLWCEGPWGGSGTTKFGKDVTRLSVYRSR